MSSSTPTTTDSIDADSQETDYSPESGHNATLDPIRDAIERVFERETGNELPDDFSKNLDWNNPRDREFVQDQLTDSDDLNDGEAILPGFGARGRAQTARDDCGDAHPFVCNQCGAALEMGRTCSMSVCSRCGAVWVRDTGAKKAAKVRRIRKEKNYRTPQDENQLEHHLVISAPPEWYAALGAAGLNFREAHNVTKEVVKAILKELRAVGLLVRHSYRGANDDGSLVDESDDRGEWGNRLYSGRDWYGDTRDELGWMPHYHGIVVSDWIEGGQLTKELQEQTGWIIHRITGRSETNTKSLPDDKAMARATIYSISHADIWLNAGANNQNLSQIWTVGSVHNPETGERDAVKSHPDFAATEHDREWAAQVAKDSARELLGLNSADTDCGEEFPPVDEPDELARRIIEDLWPDHDARRDVNADVVLEHVAEGNITVDPTTDANGRLTDVTVTDAWGDPVGPNGWGDTSLPKPSTTTAPEAATTALTTDTDNTSDNDNADCDNHDDHSHDNDGERTCSGRLIPLGAFREKGYLDNPDWCRNAPNVDEARAIDDKWSDNLDAWQATSLATEAPPRPVPD